MPDFPIEQGFKLGEWTVQPELNRLTKGEFHVTLEGKVMAVLVALADLPGRVVTKQDLLDTVWPNQAVAEGVLTRAIHELRNALRDDPQRARFIETVPRRGYRLVQDISAIEAGGVAHERQWALVAAGLCLALAAALWLTRDHVSTSPSVAVMPLVNLTGSPDKTYIGEGLAEEVIHLLAQHPSLKVTARTSSFALQDDGLTATEIGARLDADFIIEGSVREERGVQRITLQLIDSRAGTHSGSATLDIVDKDLFAAQQQLAEIIEQLFRRAQIPVAFEDSGTRALTSSRAYDLFLRGRAALHERSAQSLRDARVYFEEALSLDPHFANAHAGLAQYYLVSAAYLRVDRQHAGTLATGASAEALAADPANVDALMVAAAVAADRGMFAESLQGFRRAIELEPSNAQAHQWYGETLARLGHLEQARQSIDTALRLNPLAGSTSSVRAKIAAFFRDDPELLRAARQGAEMGALLAPRLLAVHYFRVGDREGFEREIARYHAVVGVDAGAALLLGDAMDGRIGTEALLESLAPLGEPRDNYFARELALLALPEAALDGILRGSASSGSFLDDIWLPEFAAARELPDFVDFLRTEGLVEQWRSLGPPDACRPPNPERFCSKVGSAPPP